LALIAVNKSAEVKRMSSLMQSVCFGKVFKFLT